MARRLADQLGLRSTGDRGGSPTSPPGPAPPRTASDFAVWLSTGPASVINVKRAVAPTGLTERVLSTWATPGGPVAPTTHSTLVRVRVLRIPGQERRRPAVRSGFCALVARPCRCHCRGLTACRRADPIGRVGRRIADLEPSPTRRHPRGPDCAPPHIEPHDPRLLDMIDRIDARIMPWHVARRSCDSGIRHDSVRDFTALAPRYKPDESDTR